MNDIWFLNIFTHTKGVRNQTNGYFKKIKKRLLRKCDPKYGLLVDATVLISNMKVSNAHLMRFLRILNIPPLAGFVSNMSNVAEQSMAGLKIMKIPFFANAGQFNIECEA